MEKNPNFKPLIGHTWIETLSNDESVLNELRRHRVPHNLTDSKADLTVYGNNSRLVLKHVTGQAILVWEKRRLPSKKYGIWCVLFLNNSPQSTASLLEEAMQLAKLCWIEYPFFVNIDPKAHPKDAEEVFRKCGWTSGASPADSQTVFTCEYKVPFKKW